MSTESALSAVEQLAAFDLDVIPVDVTEEINTPEDYITFLNTNPECQRLADNINTIKSMSLTITNDTDENYSDNMTPEELIKLFLPEVYLKLQQQFTSASKTTTKYKSPFDEHSEYDTEEAAAYEAIQHIQRKSMLILADSVKSYRATQYHQEFLQTLGIESSEKILKKLHKYNKIVRTLTNREISVSDKNPELFIPTLISIIKKYFIVTTVTEYQEILNSFTLNVRTQQGNIIETKKVADITNDPEEWEIIEEILYKDSFYEKLYNQNF